MHKPGPSSLPAGARSAAGKPAAVPSDGEAVREAPLRLAPVPPIHRKQADSLVIAPYASSPLRLDGCLSDLIWRECPAYELMLPREQVAAGRVVEESGRVRFVWDAEFLYLGLDLEDSDLVAEGTTNGQMHNTLGDCCELLIKPEEETWYWEFHVTPAGRSAAFFFPGRGRLCLPSCLSHRSAVRVAAHCRGTLNDWRDRDQGWTAEMAVPIAELADHGVRFEPGVRWRVLVGRYNYSRFLTTRGPELTAVPQLTRTDFHSLEDYGVLNLTR